MVKQAHRLCVGLFKQSTATGATAYSKLKDADYAKLTWDKKSIIPQSYDFTNINRASTTVETTQKSFITDLAKTTKFGSGKVTPGLITLASMLPADAESIHSILNEVAADDPYLCLFLVGAYKSAKDAVVTYDVFWASVGILTEDGAASAESGADFTGNLAFQPSGLPVETVAKNSSEMKLTLGTGAVEFNITTVSGSGT